MGFLFFVSNRPVQAACIFPLAGNATISSPCSVSTTDGLENGTLTITSSITLNSGSQLVFNNGYSIVKGSGGAINKAASATILKSNLWMIDSDADGWPASPTEASGLSTPSINGQPTTVARRRYFMSASSYNAGNGTWNTDCNDADGTKFQTLTGYADGDGDGYYGTTPSTVCAGSSLLAGYSASPGSDCNDSNIAMWRLRYRDADGDGYGAPGAVCVGNDAGYVDNASDCYDANGNAHPGQGTYFTTNRGDGSFDYNCDGTLNAPFGYAALTPGFYATECDIRCICTAGFSDYVNTTPTDAVCGTAQHYIDGYGGCWQNYYDAGCTSCDQNRAGGTYTNMPCR